MLPSPSSSSAPSLRTDAALVGVGVHLYAAYAPMRRTSHRQGRGRSSKPLESGFDSNSMNPYAGSGGHPWPRWPGPGQLEAVKDGATALSGGGDTGGKISLAPNRFPDAVRSLAWFRACMLGKLWRSRVRCQFY